MPIISIIPICNLLDADIDITSHTFLYEFRPTKILLNWLHLESVGKQAIRFISFREREKENACIEGSHGHGRRSIRDGGTRPPNNFIERDGYEFVHPINRASSPQCLKSFTPAHDIALSRRRPLSTFELRPLQ